MGVKTRVVQDPLNGYRWQAQYFSTLVGVWFDLGDAKDTREEAEGNLALAPANPPWQEDAKANPPI